MGVVWAEFGSTSKVQLTTSKKYQNLGYKGATIREGPGENTGQIYIIDSIVVLLLLNYPNLTKLTPSFTYGAV